MRVVYLNPMGALGGAEHCLLDLMASLRQAAPEVEIHLVAASAGPLLERARRLGVDAMVLPLPAELAKLGDSSWRGQGSVRPWLALAPRLARAGLAVQHYASHLRQLLKARRPDIVHSNGIKFHVLTRWAAGPGVRVLWHIHDFVSVRPVVARTLRWTASAARQAVAVSEAVARDVQAVLPHLPVQVVYNAVDTDRFSPGRADGGLLDDLAGWPRVPDPPLRIGLVATFAHWKGQDIFLDAASRLVHDPLLPPLRFYIIGGPIYHTRGSQWSRRELQARAAALGVERSVALIDFQEDVAAVYRALDLVVHASTQPEPFGLTIVEAMACARPVIVTQAGGASELFTPGHDALGVPPRDSEALAAAIRQLAHDPAARQRLAENARRTAVRRFSRDRLGPQILTLYRRMLATKTPVHYSEELKHGAGSR